MRCFSASSDTLMRPSYLACYLGTSVSAHIGCYSKILSMECLKHNTTVFSEFWKYQVNVPAELKSGSAACGLYKCPHVEGLWGASWGHLLQSLQKQAKHHFQIPPHLGLIYTFWSGDTHSAAVLVTDFCWFAVYFPLIPYIAFCSLTTVPSIRAVSCCLLVWHDRCTHHFAVPVVTGIRSTQGQASSVFHLWRFSEARPQLSSCRQLVAVEGGRVTPP